MALLAKTLITKSFLWEKKKKGFLENPDKLGWAEVTEFLKKQPDDWSEVFGIKSK